MELYNTCLSNEYKECKPLVRVAERTSLRTVLTPCKCITINPTYSMASIPLVVTASYTSFALFSSTDEILLWTAPQTCFTQDSMSTGGSYPGLAVNIMSYTRGSRFNLRQANWLALSKKAKFRHMHVHADSPRPFALGWCHVIRVGIHASPEITYYKKLKSIDVEHSHAAVENLLTLLPLLRRND